MFFVDAPVRTLYFDLDMKCEICKYYLNPHWCDKFDIKTEPEKECDDCPEASIRVTVYDEQLSDYD